MSLFLRHTARSLTRNLVIWLLIVAAVLPLGCALVLLPTLLVTDAGASPWLVVAPLLLFLFLIFAGSGGVAAWIAIRRSRRLDAAFTPLGLAGQSYRTVFRQYHGLIQGHPVAVYIARGPLVQIDLQADLKVRTSITQADAGRARLAGLFNQQVLTALPAGMEGLNVYAHDPEWANELLADPQSVALLQRLIRFEGFFIQRDVLLRPDRIRYQLYGSTTLFSFDIRPEQARQWLQDLLALAHSAAALPAPRRIEAESAAERSADSIRRNSGRITFFILAGVGAAIACIALTSAAIIIAAMLGASS